MSLAGISPARARATRGVLLLALCLTAGPAAAHDVVRMQFNRLAVGGQQSQGAVTSIVQDSDGFLWIGSEDGLLRYDGLEVKRLYRDRSDPHSLPANWVSSMVLDGQGRLWVGTDGSGVARYDATDGRFHVPTAADGRPLLDPEGTVRQLYADGSDRLWVATRTGGLQVLDLASGEARTFRHDPASAATLSSDSVFRVAEGPDGGIWIATQAGLDRLDLASGRVERFGARLQAVIGDGRATQVNALLADGRGVLWIGTPTGLLRFDPATREITNATGGGDPAHVLRTRISTLLEDDEQRLWVGTDAGLALVDRRTGHASLTRHDPSDSLSLPDDRVVALFQDRSGLLWVGTKVGGAAHWNPRSWSFGHATLSEANDNVAAFAEDRSGTLWIGTFGNGLYAVERGATGVRRFRHAPGRRDTIGDDYVMAIVVDDDDRVWYGTMTAGVERLDPRTGEITRYVHDPANPRSLAAPGVMSLLRDSRGRIWVGTYGGGLNRIDPATGEITRYPHGSAGGLSSDRATALAEGHTGHLWIGTDGGGLDVLDPLTGQIHNYRHHPGKAGAISDNSVYSLHEDGRRRMWVGTRGGGLNLALGSPRGPEGLRFESFAEPEGLPNGTVYGIQSDAAGRLWLSTNRGLSRFDYAKRAFRNFRRSHGLQSDEFNFGAHYRSASGEMFFGGPRGYNAFVPGQLRFNEHAPPVVLTAMLKLNVPVELGEVRARAAPVHLGHTDDAVTFRFAALDFTDPAANRYNYMLEGFDREWIDAADSHQATYTNLPGGRYTFRVRASNSDGHWNEDGLGIPLAVDAPPWQRWWAVLGYVVAFLLLLYAVWSAQQRKIQREAAYARRLAREVEDRTTELAERNRDLERVNLQLHEASITDALTGLGNRRSLRDAVAAVLRAVPSGEADPRGGPNFVLMVIDLDRLKPINDEFGHEAGDRVLKQVAGVLTSLCRGSDHVCRWGGDEFVVLCRDGDLAAAAVLAERIRATVARTAFRVGDAVVTRTSCSLGFATFPFLREAPARVGWEQVLALADAALYQAKRDRNMWVGIAGTPRAARLDNLLQAIDTDFAGLERDGLLAVRRGRVASDEDTIRRLVSLAGRVPGS